MFVLKVLPYWSKSYWEKKTFGLVALMANEESTPLEPLRGGESCSIRVRGGIRYIFWGQHQEKRPNAASGRPKPINLDVAWDPNVLISPKWWDERGIWLYSIVRRYVEWTPYIYAMYVW